MNNAIYVNQGALSPVVLIEQDLAIGDTDCNEIQYILVNITSVLLSSV